MANSSVTKTLLREIFTLERSQRTPEPDLVMDDPEKVAAFTQAGKADGAIAPAYLFHCAQISEVVKPGDVVLDLGCGPANMLAMAATIHRDTHFIGVDLSPDMLELASAHIKEQGLDNVELKKGDITQLNGFADDSVDAIMSTVTLHHLPDTAALEKTFSEVSRVLKPGGGLYIVDFGRLKSSKSMHDFAYRHADRQPELFTLDYLYSLQAAFKPDDFRRIVDQYLQGPASVKTTFLMPFMVTVKNRPENTTVSDQVAKQLHTIRDALPDYHKKDLSDLMGLFKMGGLPCPLLD